MGQGLQRAFAATRRSQYGEPVFESDSLAKWAGMPWGRGRARKATSCAYTGALIDPGDEVFRPISNGTNRAWRVRASAWLRSTPSSDGGE